MLSKCENFEKKAKIDISELAKQMRDTAINSTTKKLNQIRKEYTAHKENKPMLFGKDKWQDKLDRLADSYRLEKSNLDYYKSSQSDERFASEASIQYRKEHEQEYKEHESMIQMINEVMRNLDERTQAQNRTIDKGKGR